MTVHPDVVRDLLPLYAAGEASAATRALVEQELAKDPELERLAAELAAEVAAGPPAAGEASAGADEQRAFAATRRLLRLRAWLLGLALGATLMPLSFRFDGAGVHFLVLAGAPGLAVVSLVAAAGLWLAYARVARRARVSGL